MSNNMHNMQNMQQKVCREYAENMQKQICKSICQICRICHKICKQILHKILHKICKKYAKYAKQIGKILHINKIFHFVTNITKNITNYAKYVSQKTYAEYALPTLLLAKLVNRGETMERLHDIQHVSAGGAHRCRRSSHPSPCS